ncbi:TerC family protein [Nocardioides sp. BP30]|uniref:TerC family protein n=1 Tax=Nocardioides sp. BP30 TaxID=3036374 RepID=UPI0024684716|nr:TerC family protein [Nocardioides sp. BP30]WGL50745.1 TerC family protein [Nocardioides sp. BP30]
MIDTLASPTLWAISIAAVVALLALDLALTRRPHEVGMREALGWSAFYLALPLVFGLWLWASHGHGAGTEFYAGYLVEKSLSVDNLFVFMLLLSAFAVPSDRQQKVLLYGIAGALVLRGVFIALGAAALSAYDVVFLIFGAVLVATGLKLLRDTLRGHEQEASPDRMRIVRLARRVGLSPFAVVVVTVLATDLVFAVDSIPAVYGITGDPYLVFVTNAFALLGLRALYFVLRGALSQLAHLGYGLAAILVFIGAKLALHWAHGRWHGAPEVSTLLSLAVIVAILAVTVTTSLVAGRCGREASVKAGRRAVASRELSQPR